MSVEDRAIVVRWGAKLRIRKGLLAAARARLKVKPKSPSAASKVRLRKQQVADAERVIARHLRYTDNTYEGSPVPGKQAHAPDHQTAGLAGYPGYDYMAPAGSPCVSPVTGTVTRLSGHDPTNGPTNGPHGPFGWSVYIQGGGKTYFLTHMGTRTVREGQRVTQGQQIGTVGNYARWTGTPCHIHMGVHQG